MSIQYQVLGKAGRDNSLFLRVDSGNSLHRIIIDCGENTISKLSQSEIKSTDILLLSHLHLDHIAGFDYLFRRTFDRTNEPLKIFGPEDTSSIIHNRFLGFKWNLTEGLSGGYFVNDIFEEHLETFWYEARSGFSKEFVTKQSYSKIILRNENFRISTTLLNHRIPSAGYNIKEADSLNINKEKLAELNLKPGPWLISIKDLTIPDDQQINFDDNTFYAGYLRDKLLERRTGNSITYLTDFLCDAESYQKAVELAGDSDILICESQYLSEDKILAEQNYHLTAAQAADIAKKANVKKLIIFHVSERYIHNADKLSGILMEARNIFKESYFPEHWDIG